MKQALKVGSLVGVGCVSCFALGILAGAHVQFGNQETLQCPAPVERECKPPEMRSLTYLRPVCIGCGTVHDRLFDERIVVEYDGKTVVGFAFEPEFNIITHVPLKLAAMQFLTTLKEQWPYVCKGAK